MAQPSVKRESQEITPCKYKHTKLILCIQNSEKMTINTDKTYCLCFIAGLVATIDDELYGELSRYD